MSVLPAIAADRAARARATHAGGAVAALLVIAALPMLRPGVGSEFFALAGTGTVLLAGFIAVVADGLLGHRYPLAAVAVVVLLGASYWWLAAIVSRSGADVQQIAQGVVTTVVAVAAIGAVLADERRRRLVARGFVVLVTLVAASYLVTFVLWTVGGIGSFRLASVPLSKDGIVGSVFAPFTITSGTQTVGAVTIPRLTGLGREPGWMALFAIAAWFLWPLVIKRRRSPLRLLLLVAIFGTVSSAGFEVMIVVWAFQLFLQPRAHFTLEGNILRMGVGLVAIAAGIWAALFAPVFGFNDKSTYNATSFTDRQTQVDQGIAALGVAPLGGTSTDYTGSINLIAAIAPNGLPWVFLIVLTVLAPRVLVRRSAASTPIALAVLLTLIVSQPSGDSTVVFVLPLLGALVASPVTARAEP